MALVATMIMTTITATSIEPAGPSPAALLGMMWLASPALPVGAFSYSEGLEGAVDTGLVNGEAQVQAWLLDQMPLALARSDLAVAAAAWRAFDGHDMAEVQRLNDWVLQTRETAEFRQQSLQTGRSLALWLQQRSPAPTFAQGLVALLPGATWPVAFAAAAWHLQIPVRESLFAMGFGWAENMVQAAVKCVPLGQSAGQRVLAALMAVLPEHVGWALAAGEADRQSFTPLLGIASARHEQQYSRLFRS
jgi:urease accessory protein